MNEQLTNRGVLRTALALILFGLFLAVAFSGRSSCSTGTTFRGQPPPF